MTNNCPHPGSKRLRQAEHGSTRDPFFYVFDKAKQSAPFAQLNQGSLQKKRMLHCLGVKTQNDNDGRKQRKCLPGLAHPGSSCYMRRGVAMPISDSRTPRRLALPLRDDGNPARPVLLRPATHAPVRLYNIPAREMATREKTWGKSEG